MTDTAMPFDEQTVEPKPASTSTLHADLVGQIRKLVIEGDLEPGRRYRNASYANGSVSPAHHFAKHSKRSLRKVYSNCCPVAARGWRA